MLVVFCWWYLYKQLSKPCPFSEWQNWIAHGPTTGNPRKGELEKHWKRTEPIQTELSSSMETTEWTQGMHRGRFFNQQTPLVAGSFDKTSQPAVQGGTFHCFKRVRLDSVVGVTVVSSLHREFSLARSTFEVSCFLSILDKDMESFERHVMQLKPFYLDFLYVNLFVNESKSYMILWRDSLSPSPKENLVLGLNLMRLLSQNRIAEFHLELELLPKVCICMSVNFRSSFSWIFVI